MDQVAQIRTKTDIVTLISEYIPLQKAGRNFKTNCPFHGEKTPSFVISPERQIWHCFGCGKGGDCYTFLMEYEHLEFPEALRMLAKRAGVQLQQSNYDSGVATKKEKLYAINKLAAEYYHYILTKHPAGKQALSYLLEKRKLHPGLLETFLIGYSPQQNDGLALYLLKKKGYKKEDVQEAGLIFSRGVGVSDFFFNRIMFPLFDHRDNVLGFSGRTMSDSVQPKYINTKDTLVYQKGSNFFGLNLAKNAIKKENQAIVMEGEFDVIAAFSQGIENAVAVKGSGLTDQQAQLLARFTQKITLCFDQDSAGQEAIKRSIPALEKRGVTITVLRLTGGKDPDEVIQKDPVLFKKAVKEDLHVYDFLLETVLNRYDTKTAEGKRKISDSVLPFYEAIENEIVKEHYLKKLSTTLDISLESITKQGEKIVKKEEKTVTALAKNQKKVREALLEEYLLALLLQHENPKEILPTVQKIFSENDKKIIPFFLEAQQKLFENLLSFCKQNDTFKSDAFALFLPKELLQVFNTSSLFPLPVFASVKNQEEEIEKVAKERKVLWLKTTIKDLTEKMKDAQNQQNDTLSETLQGNFRAKTQELKTLTT